MRTTIGIAVLLVALASAGLAGCVAVAAGAAGAAGYAYVAGNAEGTVAATPERVEEAALSTFRELGIELERTRRDEEDGKTTLLGEGPEQPVRVTIRREGQASRLFVRVGLTGNEALSRTVYERIAEKL